jgi:hypothetical protein
MERTLHRGSAEVPTVVKRLVQPGFCEELKLGVHAAALTLAAVMGAYNAVAWLVRRERHLGVNTVIYAALIVWEQQLVAHHWTGCRVRPAPAPAASTLHAVLTKVV